jgi:MFS family permease
MLSFAHGLDHFTRRLIPPLIPIWAFLFGTPLWQIALIPALLLFGSAVFHIPAGIISDTRDRRYLLPFGTGLLGLSYLLFTFAAFNSLLDFTTDIFGYPFNSRLLVMMLAMFLGGMGTSVLHPTGLPLLTTNISPELKGRAYGMWNSAAKFGDGLGPAVLGILLLYMNWPLIFIFFGLVHIFYAVFLLISLKDYDTSPPILSENIALGSSSVWKSDPRIYTYPLLAVLAFISIKGVGDDGLGTFIPTFIIELYSYTFEIFGTVITSTSTASLYYSATLISAAFFSIWCGQLVDKYDPKTVLIAFAILGVAPIFVLAFVDLSPMALLLVLILLGASIWGAAPARDALISSIAPPEMEGRTFAYLWTGALLFGSVSPILVGYIGDVSGLRTAFGIMSIFIVLSVLPLFLLYSKNIYLPSKS